MIDAFLPEVTALHKAQFAALDEHERETFNVLLATVAAAIATVDVDGALAKTRPRRKRR